MTPVERMARAIGKTVDGRTEASRLTPWTMLAANEALKALREPSEAMKAAFDRDFDAWHNEKIEDPYHLWKCMIDAALSET